MQKIKVITVADREHEYLNALKQSCIRHGMDLHVIVTPWKGFGTKVIETKKYLETLQGYTHFIFVDAYDTLFLRPIKEVPNYLLFNAEKQKWPDADVEYPFPYDVCTWAYLNSGVYSSPIETWLNIINQNPIKYEEDDQRYYTKLFLKYAYDGVNCNINYKAIQLDNSCEYFQSYAFNSPGDFNLIPFTNLVHNTQPAIIHFNGKCHDKKIYSSMKYQTLAEVQQAWKDTPEQHHEINETFIELVNAVPKLNEHRTFVEQNIFGFGERSFHWMWKLIVDALPDNFTFLEIGVLKGQTLSLARIVSLAAGKKVKRYGVTPLNTEGGVWESDYDADIKYIHEKFNVSKDYTILKGLSEDPEIIKKASKLVLDVLYIDGGHEERHIRNDFENYAPLVKPGGFLVIDDCCNRMQMPFGYFQGIEAVSRYVDSVLPPFGNNPEWEFLFSVVHNRVYRRK